MRTLSRSILNIGSMNLNASQAFYKVYFGFTVAFESDWYIQLQSPVMELGLIDSENAMMPEAAKGKVQGIYITLVIEDVDQLHVQMQSDGVKIIEPPSNMPYGQRRMLVLGPNAEVIDVSSPIPNFQYEPTA